MCKCCEERLEERKAMEAELNLELDSENFGAMFSFFNPSLPAGDKPFVILSGRGVVMDIADLDELEDHWFLEHPTKEPDLF